MPELDSKSFKRYTALRDAVLELLDRGWLGGEAHFSIDITDDKGRVEGSLKGGDTFRTKKMDNGEE